MSELLAIFFIGGLVLGFVGGILLVVHIHERIRAEP